MTETTVVAECIEPIDEPALLIQHRRLGRLRFQPQLETDFLHYMHRKMCSRARVIAGCCIVFTILFVWVDRTLLPEPLHRLSIAVRLTVLLLVCSTLWYSNRPDKVAPGSAFTATTLCYVTAGLMLSMVVLICRAQQVAVPVAVTHDTLYLILLSGFFLLGLPSRHAIVGSWIIVLSYLAGEILIGTPQAMVLGSGLFLCCCTMMGSVGAYVYEHMLRSAYLNEQLLKAARVRAERESQSKTRFLATTSHDLRQPLHAMSLFIQHLEEKISDVDSRQTLSRLAASTHLLQAMLSSLLDMSRLTMGMVRPQFRPLNLRSWLQELLDSFESSARERGIALRLECPDDCAVNTDSMLLGRLLRNYLNNALVHSGATQVQLLATRIDDQVRIAVIDNGCGLSRDERKLIFDEFTQLHNPARTLEKGVGLGLSICRQLQHLLEYPSGVVSEPGQGACFWVEVPAGEWRAETRPQVDAGGPVLGGQVVLVENDLVIREAMETLLRHWGCEVRCYPDAASLLQTYDGENIDLLLTDYRLEGAMNGLQLIKALQDADLYCGPAALITADTSDEVTEAAQQAAVIIIHKPVLPARLRRTVQMLLVRY